MLSRLFAVMLAVLAANPICCCQDLSILWSSIETETSCGCQQSSDEEVPNGNCSTCPSKFHKVSSDASTELPSPQVHDLTIQERERISYQAEPPISGAMLAANTLPRLGRPSFRAAYGVYRL